MFLGLVCLVSLRTAGHCQAEPNLPSRDAVAVAVGDLDGDADVDLLFAIDGGRPSVVLNRGMAWLRLDGAFSEHEVDVRDLCLADFDGDGDLDVALACYRQPNVVCYNDGAGRFLVRAELDGQRDAWTSTVGAADLDGDGRPDLVFGTLDRGLECWSQVGDRRWRHMPAAVAASKDRSACLAVGDLDGDGFMDVVCGNQPDASKRGGADRVFMGTGTGKLVPASRASSLGRFQSTSLALADLDDDGDLDLVAAHTGAARQGARNSVHAYNGRFGRGVESRMPKIEEVTRAVAVGDLDGDGDLDIVFGNDGRDRLMLNDGSGRFRSAPALTLPQDRSNSTAVALADFDGDSDLDLVIAKRDGPSSLLLNDGEGRFLRWEAGATAEPGSVADPAQPDAPSVPEGTAPAAAGQGLRDLLGQIQVRPTTAAAVDRSVAALEAIGRLGTAGASAMVDLCDMLGRATAADPTPLQRRFVAALIETIGDLAPCAEVEAVDVRAIVAATVAEYGDTRAFARTWTRLQFADRESTERLLARIGDSNPFASECAFELYQARGETDPGHVSALVAGLSRSGVRVSLDVPGTLPFHVSFPDPPGLTERIAAFLLQLDPTNRVAKLHLLTLATDRWGGSEAGRAGVHLWSTAISILAGLDLAGFDSELQGVLQEILVSSKPGTRHLDRERNLVHAVLEFASRSIGAAIKGSGSPGSSTDLERRRRALAWVTRALLSDSKIESAARTALGRIAIESAKAEFEVDPAHAVPNSLRRRAVARKPGDASRIVEAGLEWLARNQSPDGRWRFDRVRDCGISGLALSVFLGEGITHLEGEYSTQVATGLRWLLEQQDETGLFGARSTSDFIYSHAIALLAVAEAWGLTGDPMLEAAVRRGSEYLHRHKNPTSGWRYQYRDGDVDTSVTTWCVVALAAASDAGLELPPKVFAGVEDWYLKMLEVDSGRVGYTEQGGRSSRLSGDHSTKFPRQQTEAMTAAAMFGSIRAAVPMWKQFRAQLRLLAIRPPSASESARGSLDYYYWFWASQAAHQLGGKDASRWRAALVGALDKLQQDKGVSAGSFDPISVWGSSGGRVYATAMALLALQAEYRWTRQVPANWRGSRR